MAVILEEKRRFSVHHDLVFYPDSVVETINSTVVKAQDVNIMRDVCVKIIPIDGDSKRVIKEKKQRAMKEARTLGRLSGITRYVPGLRFVDYDDKNQKLYIVMDWLEGKTLREQIDSSSVRSNAQFITWMIETCRILKDVEKLNFSHKDLKPENIIIDKEGRAHLIDFNISTSSANKVEGTPGYKAPEMERGLSLAGRNKVDMFAMGIIMYEFFAKKRPVKGVDYAAPFRGNEWEYFKEPKEYNPEISTKLNSIITRCMEYRPEDRFNTISELESALRGLPEMKPQKRKK